MSPPRSPEIILRALLERDPEAHKYDFGHVLVLGGSPGMVGAPYLAARAVLRAGAGLVTIAAPAAVTAVLESRVNEIMTLALPENGAAEAARTFMAERRVSVVVMGPGAGPGWAEFMRELMMKVNVPAVIDAGGLAALVGHTDGLAGAGEANPGLILTPHAGEFKKLAGVAASAGAAGSLAREHHVTIVLKGHRTVVAHPDGTAYTNQTGNPGMATAGTGDVLSGIIGGLLAQKLSPAEASVGGVYLHGLAGDLAGAAKTQPGLIAGDLIEYIPQAYCKVKA
jgi:hydroxyethylthiazole kinase-like uncharacterized protein yjeF